jgi:hypothetical protein
MAEESVNLKQNHWITQFEYYRKKKLKLDAGG